MSEYHVGDTITVISTFHREVLGYNSEGDEVGYFDMINVSWKVSTSIYRIDSDSGESRSVISEFFDFIENPLYDYEEVQYSEGSTGLNGDYNFQNDSFRLVYKLVTLIPGTYLHEVGSSAGLGGDSQSFEGKCNGGFSAYLQINKGMDNNISFLSESPNPHYNNWMLSDLKTRFYEMGGFAFKVIP